MSEITITLRLSGGEFNKLENILENCNEGGPSITAIRKKTKSARMILDSIHEDVDVKIN